MNVSSSSPDDGTAESNDGGVSGESVDQHELPRVGPQKLDARWIGLCRTINAISVLMLGPALLVAGMILLLNLSLFGQALVLVAWGVAALYFTAILLWLPRWQYDCWDYRLSETILELRYGIVWRCVVTIPLTRIQHVDLHRGPLERRWGLASLRVHTAGTRDASHTIPGLDFERAQELRDRLIDVAKRGDDGPADTAN